MKYKSVKVTELVHSKLGNLGTANMSMSRVIDALISFYDKKGNSYNLGELIKC